MSQLFNVYCDESCHLENDKQGIMVLGAIWCPKERVREVTDRIREIKEHHNLSPTTEVKWVKVSPSKVRLYRDLLDYFYDDDDLHFRTLVVPDKSLLDHETFAQSHDDWYYKMYFDMLKVILAPEARYHIYLDYKDTHGGHKVEQLHKILCHNAYDFNHHIIERVQIIRSHEAELMQLTDILIGAVSYANRGLNTSTAKAALVDRMRKRSGYKLTLTTLYGERKTNVFRWSAGTTRG